MPVNRPLAFILAPTSLGLRPNSDGSLPGTWRAPDILVDEGLARLLSPVSITRLSQPDYKIDAEEGSRIRNGNAIREFSTELGVRVAAALKAKHFPVVLGGDCSILLGCLLGTRAKGPVGLVHVDGHSDFYHPGNYDIAARLGSAAGMDLALATGRGEPLLALWDGKPLVRDADVTQIGEREELDLDYAFPDIESTIIRRFPVRQVLHDGIAATARQVLAGMPDQSKQLWLHVDLDVLDQSVMPAVDSPGSPGLDFTQLADLIARLFNSGRVIGIDISIFDPELDRDGQYAAAIAACLGQALGSHQNANHAGPDTVPRQAQ